MGATHFWVGVGTLLRLPTPMALTRPTHPCNVQVVLASPIFSSRFTTTSPADGERRPAPRPCATCREVAVVPATWDCGHIHKAAKHDAQPTATLTALQTSTILQPRNKLQRRI